MLFEPEDDEEELYALRGALSGTGTPTGCMGCLGLAGSGFMVLAGAGMLTADGGGPEFTVIGLIYLAVAVLYAIAPSLLLGAAMQKPANIDDHTAPIRQARLLMVFWWIAAFGAMATAGMYVLSFVLFGLAFRM